MTGVINASDARRGFSQLIDTVVHDRPTVIKRNRDLVAAISVEQLKGALADFRFTIQIEFDEKQDVYTGSLKEIDLMWYADSEDKLKRELAKQLIDYANDYFEYGFYKAVNRKHHYFYVLNVLLQESEEKVMELIHA